MTRKPFIVAEEVARIGVEKTVAELQSALTWEEDRKDEEQVMLDRYVPAQDLTPPVPDITRTPCRDKLYLRDAEALNAILSTRAAAASSASRRPTGESLVMWVAAILTGACDTLTDVACTAARKRTTTRSSPASDFYKAVSSRSSTTYSQTTPPMPGSIQEA